MTADATGRRIRIALSAGIVMSFLTALAGPSNWLWGMNLLRYYPRPLAFLWTLAALAAVWLLPDWPHLREKSRAGDSGARGSLSPPPIGWSIPPLALAGIAATFAAVIFFLFRSESLLLGDGMEIVRRLHQGNVPAPRSPLFNVIEPIFFHMFSGGDMAREGPAAAILSIVAGVIAVAGTTFFLARLGVRQIRENCPAGPAGAIAAGTLLLLTGSIQLFFGYVEAYPLLAAATVVFFAAAFDRLDGGGNLAMAAATIAVFTGVAAHPFGFTLVPGWLYLIAVKRQESGMALGRRRVATAAVVGLLAFVALFAVFALRPELRQTGGAFRFVAPQELWHGISGALGTLGNPRPWADRYRVMSLVHLADFWNTLWLVGACAVCVIAGISSSRGMRRAFSRPPVILALVSLVGVALFRALFRTPLGAMRDWDLFSGLGLGVAALAAALALTTPARFAFRPIAAAAVFFVVPWVGIQTSTERAATRHFEGIEAVPRPEPAVAAFFHCVMGDRFANLHRYDLAASAYERALSAWPRYDFAWRLGTIEMTSKNYARAARAFERAIELAPSGDPSARVLLAEALMGSGDLAGATAVLEKILAVDPACGVAHLRYAQIEKARGRHDAAVAQLALAARYLRADETAARNELAEVRRVMAADGSAGGVSRVATGSTGGTTTGEQAPTVRQ